MTVTFRGVGVRRFAHVDAMRAAAVMLVVAAHSGLSKIVPGGSGVTIFFSISGFIITYLLLRERDKTDGFAIGSFYLRRILKIGPPLLVVVVIPTLIYALFEPVKLWVFATQVLFTFNWAYLHDMSGGGVMPGTDVVWSLAIEEQFYIAFALLWLLIARSARYGLTLVAAAGFGIAYPTIARLIIANGTLEASNRIYFGTDTRLDGIAWGVITAVLLHKWGEQSRFMPRLRRLIGSDAALVLAVVMYLVSLVLRDPWLRDTFRYSLQSIAACIIILYGFQQTGSRLRKGFNIATHWRWVQCIGLSSYSIYLVHLPLYNVFNNWFPGIGRSVGIPVRILIGVSAGILLYRLLEVPFERLRHRLHREDAARARHPDAAPT